MSKNLQASFGNIDIYLFDQLLKGRYSQCRNVLDVGCGGGRNLVYFLQNGFEVYGVDQSERTVDAVKELSRELAPDNPVDNFKVAKVEELPFADVAFDL